MAANEFYMFPEGEVYEVKKDDGLQDKNIIIDWVRHAESCSNLIAKSNVDTYVSTTDLGYNRIESQPELPHSSGLLGNFTGFIKSLPSKIASTNIEPPLSFIGVQHAINLGNKYITEEKA